MSARLLDENGRRTTRAAVAFRAKLQAQCDQWNEAVEVGAPVILSKDLDEEVETRTRSAAQILSGHTAVVWLEGIVGCWELDRVRPA